MLVRRAVTRQPWHFIHIVFALAAFAGEPANLMPFQRGIAGHEPAASVAPGGRVTDLAGRLTVKQSHSLTAKLATLEKNTKHQMVVVIVPSLGGADVKSFTIALANRWGVGRRRHNDGVVLLVAPNERKARISVGRGLEKVLPDAFCRDIMDNHMIPHFKKGDLYGGIDAGVDGLIERLR
jgi:uncharacterized protein